MVNGRINNAVVIKWVSPGMGDDGVVFHAALDWSIGSPRGALVIFKHRYGTVASGFCDYWRIACRKLKRLIAS